MYFRQGHGVRSLGKFVNDSGAMTGHERGIHIILLYYAKFPTITISVDSRGKSYENIHWVDR